MEQARHIFKDFCLIRVVKTRVFPENVLRVRKAKVLDFDFEIMNYSFYIRTLENLYKNFNNLFPYVCYIFTLHIRIYTCTFKNISAVKSISYKLLSCYYETPAKLQ